MGLRNYLALFLVIFFAFSVHQCKSKKIIVPPPAAPDYETEGWLNDSTFQVRVVGQPYRSAKGFSRRRRQAQRSARLLAEKRAVTLMAEKLGSKTLASSIQEKLKSTIKDGRVVKRNFNIEDECSVVYRVSQKGLKAKVASLAKP